MSFEHPTREELRELARLIVDEQEKRKLEPQFLDEAAAARLCGLSPRSLQQMRYDGSGPPFIKLGDVRRGIIRYSVQDLHLWMATRQRYARTDDVREPSPVRHRTKLNSLAALMEKRARKRRAKPKSIEG
jgi:hypothetical protein